MRKHADYLFSASISTIHRRMHAEGMHLLNGSMQISCASISLARSAKIVKSLKLHDFHKNKPMTRWALHLKWLRGWNPKYGFLSFCTVCKNIKSKVLAYFASNCMLACILVICVKIIELHAFSAKSREQHAVLFVSFSSRSLRFRSAKRLASRRLAMILVQHLQNTRNSEIACNYTHLCDLCSFSKEEHAVLRYRNHRKRLKFP